MRCAESSLGAVRARLARAGCIAAGEEALQLVTAAPDAATLASWTARRERGEPLAWITGTTRFCGRTILVDAGVYVPRPQTEELAQRAGELLPEGGRAADLCTGSGALAVHLAASVPTADVVGVDIDRRAVRCARSNGVDVVLGDLAAPLGSRLFDMVTSVAPYVPTSHMVFLPADVQCYEPRLALDGGADGLVVVRRVVDAAARLLRQGGWLLVEVGAEQERLLAPTLEASGLAVMASWRDADGDLRGVAAQAVRWTG